MVYLATVSLAWNHKYVAVLLPQEFFFPCHMSNLDLPFHFPCLSKIICVSLICSLSPNKYFLILQVPKPLFRSRITGRRVMEPGLSTVLFWLATWEKFTGQGRITWLLGGKKNVSSLHFLSWRVPWDCVRSGVRTRGGGQVVKILSSICRGWGVPPRVKVWSWVRVWFTWV